MSSSPPKRAAPKPAQKAPAEFNRPPTDEEVAQDVVERVDERARETPGPLRAAAITDETPSDETPLSEFASEASLDPSSASCDVAFASPRADSVVPAYEVPGAEYRVIDGSTTSDVARAKHEAGLDRRASTEWAAEIAQLQALIEALTEKVEWRIPNATRR